MLLLARSIWIWLWARSNSFFVDSLDTKKCTTIDGPLHFIVSRFPSGFSAVVVVASYVVVEIIAIGMLMTA